MGYQAKDLEFLLLKQKKIKKLIKSLVNTDLFAWGHPGGVMRSIFFNLGAILTHETSNCMFSGSWRIF